MIYFANPAGPSVIAAMHRGAIGMIDTPGQAGRARVRLAHEGAVEWIADNSCFGSSYPGDDVWFAWLAGQAKYAATCRFATAPDVVGNAWKSHFRSEPWLARIRALGYPVAYVAQDRLQDLPIPWHSFDALFIGGSTEWKLGPHAQDIAAQAKRRGKWLHMGRVNSRRRWDYAQAIGCDSVDGTSLVFGPDQNLKKLLRWTASNQQAHLMDHEGRPL